MPVKEKNPGAVIPEQMLATIFHSFTEEEIEALRSRVLDCALGVRLAVRSARERPRGGEEYEGTRTDEDGEVWHVYTRPPDIQMLNLLFAQAVGRPGQRKQAAQDPLIEIRHYVPGFVFVPEKDDVEPGVKGDRPDTDREKTRALLLAAQDELAREKMTVGSDDDDLDFDLGLGEV